MSDIYKTSQPSFIQSPFTCLTNLSTNPASWPTMNTSHMIETLWNPQKITHIFLALNMFQCILMHPNFQYSSWARITRLCIALISFPWWVCYPFKVVLLPLDQHIFENGTNGANCVMWGMKVIEWGFARGPYLTHRHPSKSTKSKLSNEVKPIMIVKDEHDKKLEGNDYLDWGLTQLTSSVIYTHSLFLNLTLVRCFFLLLMGIFLVFDNVFISFRGFRCSWGSVKITPHLNFFETLVSLYQNYLIGLISAISLIAVRDSPDVTPASALTQIGLPPFFYGHSIFARCIHTLSYGLAIKSVIEFINLSFSLISHIIYPIIISLRILPNSICEFFNPIWYPPAFNSIFKSDSLAHFWGKAWHQMFRRGFMICGGIPASRLALHLGLNHQSQRLAGLFGTFAFSGLVHEYCKQNYLF